MAARRKSPEPSPKRPPSAARVPHPPPKAGPERAPRPAPLRASRAGARDLTPAVASNVRRHRGERGWSLQQLADASGVSRAMLGQIELGKSAPTINVLWKIAGALGLPFSALLGQEETSSTVVLRAAAAKELRSADGTFSTRALFPVDRPRQVEFYELHLAPHASELADAHAPGTAENLVVTRGALEIAVGGDRRVLHPGDAIFFRADEPHAYHNPGAEELVAYLVMTYVRPG